MILSLITLFLAAAEPASPETPVVVVTTQADSGPGSLRQAIVDVPANGNIGFGVEGEILLTSGELVVHKPLHIVGGHQRRIVVRGNPNNFNLRVFHITAGPVTVSDLTVRGGE